MRLIPPIAINHLMKHSRYITCCLVSIILLSVPILLCANPLEIQVEASEPWGFYHPISSNGEYRHKLAGIWIDIIELLSKRTGLEINTSLAPHARVVQNLENGKVDLSFLVRTRDVNPKVMFLVEILPVATIVVSLQKTKIKVFNDLYGIRIGIVRGSENEPRFDEDSALFKQAYRNHKIIVNMLFQRRLDAIVGDSVSIPYLIQKQGFNQTTFHTFTLYETPVWITLSSNSNNLPDPRLLIKANGELKKSGIYDRIIRKYTQ